MSLLPARSKSLSCIAVAAVLIAVVDCSVKPRYAYRACGARLPDRIVAGMRQATDKGKFQIQLAVLSEYKWSDSRRLRVRFLDGNEGLRGRVLTAAQQWSSYANITFTRVNTEPSDIRLSAMSKDDAFWSYYGNDANNYAGQETLHLGFVNPAATPDEDLIGYVLHEFGHALGAVHEHQSPSANIHWNKEVVYKFYFDVYGWSREKVDANIFWLFSNDDVSASPFDPRSIMLYAIPKEFTTDGFSTRDNKVLSDGDKSFIRAMYP